MNVVFYSFSLLSHTHTHTHTTNEYNIHTCELLPGDIPDCEFCPSVAACAPIALVKWSLGGVPAIASIGL